MFCARSSRTDYAHPMAMSQHHPVFWMLIPLNVSAPSRVLNVHPIECFSPIQCSECPPHGMFQHHLVFWPGDLCCCRWTESSCMDGCRPALFLDRVQQIVKERFYLTVRRRKLRSMQVFNSVPRTSQVVLEWACLCKLFFFFFFPLIFDCINFAGNIISFFRSSLAGSRQKRHSVAKSDLDNAVLLARCLHLSLSLSPVLLGWHYSNCDGMIWHSVTTTLHVYLSWKTDKLLWFPIRKHIKALVRVSVL